MPSGAITKPERDTQNRVIRLFENELDYTYLGNWQDKCDNSNIEKALLCKFLSSNGHSPEKIEKVIFDLTNPANNHDHSLYYNNKKVYEFLRFGVFVKVAAGVSAETIQLINWQEPLKNNFYAAEEVTINGKQVKRSDSCALCKRHCDCSTGA